MTGAPIALVAHDAGGAELLASFAYRTKLQCKLVLEGPAVRVFTSKFGPVETCSLRDAISTTDSLLCGTSWQSDLEWEAIELARQAGRRSAAFLDHWVNYLERFVRNGVKHLPDEIWVPDEYARTMAADVFPDIPISLVANPYLLEVQRYLAERPGPGRPFNEASPIVLFVCENISGHARLRHGAERHWGYTEFDAIEYFLRHRHIVHPGISKVVIRPHPSELADKYQGVLHAHGDLVELSDGRGLLEDISRTDIVVGCNSMAMVVALAAGKKVVSCIPPGGARCCLPQKEIVHLREATG